MRAVVGVTDNDWAAFLRDRPLITEANFWLPSAASTFRALSAGQPFLFKTHWPENQLVGGGFFSGYSQLTIAEAWSIHGEGNGVASLEELTLRIARYRKTLPDPQMVIGCVLLRNLFFTPLESTRAAPPDFAKNIVRFKGYELGAGSPLEATLRDMLAVSGVRVDDDDGAPRVVPGEVYGLDRLTKHRVGQRAFQSLVLTGYHRRCAVTGNKVSPVLQAAHIRPVSKQGENRVDNGLLLRSDVHILFDSGYLGINDRHQIQVSRRLRDDYGNGDEFYALAGSVIDLPDRRIDRPSVEAVTWHMDEVFLR